MEFPLISRAPNPTTASFSSCRLGLCDLPVSLKKYKKKRCGGGGGGVRVSVVRVKAMGERSSEGIDGGGERKGGGGYTSSAMEVTTFNQSFGEAEFPVWEKIGAVVRLSYGIG